MSIGALHSERGREVLSQRILEVLDSWPELYRQVFVRSHYWGDSTEMISASMDMTPADVAQMLERCDQQLLTALRPLRQETVDQNQPDPEQFKALSHGLCC